MDKYYILILGWVAVMGILSIMISMKRVETVCGKEEYRWKPVWAVVTVCHLYGCAVNVAELWIQGHIWRDLRICGSVQRNCTYIGTVKKE